MPKKNWMNFRWLFIESDIYSCVTYNIPGGQQRAGGRVGGPTGTGRDEDERVEGHVQQTSDGE